MFFFCFKKYVLTRTVICRVSERYILTFLYWVWDVPNLNVCHDMSCIDSSFWSFSLVSPRNDYHINIDAHFTPPPLMSTSFLLTVFYMRFQVLVASRMKITGLWDIALCNLVEVDRRFRVVYCLHHHRPDDGGSTHVYMSAVSQRLPSSVVF
jgi:hypothetical protein